MAAGSRGPIVVILVGALLAGGGGAAYLLHFGPKKARGAEKAEVESLAPKWKATRDCLLGETPMAADTAIAFKLRELAVVRSQDDFRECERLLGEAGRGTGQRHREKTEAAWEAYRLGRGALAKALAHRTAKRTRRLPSDIRDHIATGLAEAEIAYQSLREQVGLDRDGSEAKSLGLPGEIRALLPGVDAAALGRLEVKNNRVLALDISTEKRALHLFTDSGTQLSRFGAEAYVAAAPAPGWGVYRDEVGIAEKAFDAPDDQAPKPIAKLTKESIVAGAIGSKSGERVVVTFDPSRPAALSVFHSAALQTPFKKSQIKLPDLFSTTPLREVDLMFSRLVITYGQTSYEWNPSDLRAPSQVEAVYPVCFSDNASWWQAPTTGLLHSAGGEVARVAGSEDMPNRDVACSDTQFLSASLSSGQQFRVRLCSQRSCPLSTALPLPSGGRRFVLIAPKRGPVIATSVSDVLLTWTTDEDGSGLKIGPSIQVSATEILGVVEWKGELAAVIKTDSEDDSKLELAVLRDQ